MSCRYLGATREEASWKTDVYAFGVVLLELISGQRALDSSFKPGLVEWVSLFKIQRHFFCLNTACM